eukprot:8655574-Alexandrium_andersonii.AAC.1
MTRQAKSAGCSLVLGPARKAVARHAAGVGFLAAPNILAMPVKPITASFVKYKKAGRVRVCAVSSSLAFAVRVCAVYGWAGGATHAEQRARG